MRASTVQATQNSNVTLKGVTEKIEEHFELLIANGLISVNTEKTYGVNLYLQVNEDTSISRLDVQDEILKKIYPNNSLLVEPGSPGSGDSSLGGLLVGEYQHAYVRIVLQRAGTAARGIGNENELAKQINWHTRGQTRDTVGITVKFRSKDRKEYTVHNVIGAEGVGTVKKNKDLDQSSEEQFPKSDVNIIRSKGETVPVSIKQDNASLWASVESWYYENGGHVNDKSAKWYIENAAATEDKNKINGVAHNLIELKVVSNAYILTNPTSNNKPLNKVRLVWKASEKMIDAALFGSDIYGKGLIVRKTFNKDDFKLEGQTLVVHTNQNIVEKKDASGDVYMICYYTQGRSLSYKHNDIQKNITIAVRACTKSFAFGKYGTNTIFVKRNNNTLQFQNKPV